ncbi:MAG: AbrB/MazE/SpoVT family DNA-binding domain-containing protein [Gemmatimonadales bacterium]|uniref:AbrB/MazE/SpoVT family DNA-binding domain-containing protein n=1 Tax=Candidatus Palauibacter irciniicola TaxID=3056733 RepID=UPI00138098FF|nr:AbrB/MazE/SpoVT family DNA-binding domain-containing protein [Candidatus Palauibacter irciniicola]MYC17330.1 AbrB/MazE/SpoVT family DNA-binding domain-containing protein [Gemmatimonadales bacterium]
MAHARRGKGQVTLPKPIRERLDLKAGDRIAFGRTFPRERLRTILRHCRPVSAHRTFDGLSDSARARQRRI